MKKLPQKPFKIGTYQLGFQWVDLWVDPSNDDGAFEWSADRKCNCRVVLGIASPEYSKTLGTLLHEVIEELTCELGLRYKKSSMFTEASDTYYFHMNHAEFTEVMARAGHFVRMSQVDLMTIHKKYHPKA